jgi:hypothetical protein
MAYDYSQLRPVDVARVLNRDAAPGHEVDIRVIRRHQDLAGTQIGADGRIHLLRYAAWLRARWKVLQKAGEAKGSGSSKGLVESYQQTKAVSAAKSRQASEKGRDIGELPPIKNRKRRAAGLADLETFCLTYLDTSFFRPFSRSHKKAAKKIELAIRNGGCFAFAMPRGFGKSTLAKAACLWAILKGKRRFACLIAASATMAERRLKEIKTWCETRPRLLEDFPEVFYPIRKLDGIPGRAPGQRYHGQPTRIEWSADKIVFPTMPNSVASGAVISACGLKGSEVRGQSHTLADGDVIRPDFVLLDDPQTKESARSVLQCDEREETVFADVMGMADSRRGIAIFAAVTVICPNDLAMRLLDRKRHPEFQGERTPMLWSLPENLPMWDEYGRIRTESLIADGDGVEAVEFYLANREAMDKGAEAAWPEFFLQTEISAIQHAMNLRLQDLRAFLAECQNEPLDEANKHGQQLTIEIVSHKIGGAAQGVVPIRCSHVTAYIDVHDKILYYVVSAWESDFTGWIIDYGTYPKQSVPFFAQSAPPVPLSTKHKGAGKDAIITAGLDAIEEKLLTREWIREDGAIMRIGKLLKDMGYEGDAVRSQSRRSRFGDLTMPAKGHFLRPGQEWYSYFNNKPGGQTGYHWRIPPPEDGLRFVLVDADHFKTMAADRIQMPANDPGGWTLFGRVPREHEPFAEQCCAEGRVWIQRGEAGKWHWEIKPGGPDNHWWDCLCGTAVGASLLGITVPGIQKRTRKRIKLSELQRRKR